MLPVLTAALCIVFLSSGLGKLLSPRRFLYAVEQYDLVPRPLIIWVGTTLILVELFVGLIHLVGAWVLLGAIVGLLLLATFFMAVAYALLHDRRIPCGCFAHDELISGRVLVRLVLLALAEGIIAYHLSLQPTPTSAVSISLVSLGQAALLLQLGMWVLSTELIRLLRSLGVFDWRWSRMEETP